MKHLIAILALFSTSAFAVLDDNSTNQNQGQLQGQGQGQAQGQGQLQGQAQGQLQGQGQGQGQGQSQGLVNTNLIGVGVDVSNRIDNDVRNNAAAFAAGGKASAGALSGSLSGSSSGGNSLTVNEAPIPADTSVTYGGTYTVKGVPSIGLGTNYPTAPCMGSSNIGGSGVGFSFGVGTSWTDHECGKRETARSFFGMGMKEDALAVLCSTDYAAVAPSCAAAKAK